MTFTEAFTEQRQFTGWNLNGTHFMQRHSMAYVYAQAKKSVL